MQKKKDSTRSQISGRNGGDKNQPHRNGPVNDRSLFPATPGWHFNAGEGHCGTKTPGADLDIIFEKNNRKSGGPNRTATGSAIGISALPLQALLYR